MAAVKSEFHVLLRGMARKIAEGLAANGKDVTEAEVLGTLGLDRGVTAAASRVVVGERCAYIFTRAHAEYKKGDRCNTRCTGPYCPQHAATMRNRRAKEIKKSTSPLADKSSSTEKSATAEDDTAAAELRDALPRSKGESARKTTAGSRRRLEGAQPLDPNTTAKGGPGESVKSALEKDSEAAGDLTEL